MKYFLNTRADDTVLVLNQNGQVMANFESIEDAIEAYDWAYDVDNDDGLMATDAASIGI